MDVKRIWIDYLIVIFVLILHKGICFEEDYDDTPSFGRCPWIRNKLKNGRVKLRSRGRIAKFLCDPGYELAGKRFATCVRGQWNNPIPVCVARGCQRQSFIANGRVTEMYRGAMLVYDCNPGYSLDGVVSIHCDGRRWSTEPPACVVATSEPEVSCDFEDPDLCGWSHDPTHEFEWKRNQFNTPSGHVGTGPSYDHTFGVGKGGFYLYLEASSPRKENDKARLFSPVYPSDYSDCCFVFWYHMYGATTGGLNVYLKLESHVFSELSPTWEKHGDQGNQWQRGYLEIPPLNENFQIIIEGVRGSGYVGDSAIDDVQLMKTHCDNLENVTDVVASTVAESCRGRCREQHQDSSCGCNENCYLNENCCNDYATICTAGNETAAESIEEIVPESEIGKNSSVITMAVTKISSVEPITESAILSSTSSDSVTSSTLNTTATSITASITTAAFIPSTTSSTPEDASLTSPTIKSSSTSYYSSSEATTDSTIVSPSVPNIEIKPTVQRLSITTDKITTLISSPSTTTTKTTASTTTVKPTTSTTTEKSSTTTTTEKPTSTTTTDKTTSTTTTEKTTSTTTTEKTATASMQTTQSSTTQSQIAAVTVSTTVAVDIINPLLLSTIPTVNISAGSSSKSEAVSIPLTHSSESASTTAASSSQSSSITSTPSTRKTYNLRPRTQKTTLSISISTPSSTGTVSSELHGAMSISPTTNLSNTDVTKAINSETSSIIPHKDITTSTTRLQSVTETTSLKPLTMKYDRGSHTKDLRKSTFRIHITTETTFPTTTTTGNSLNHASREASTADKDSLPTVTIIGVSIAIILCVAGGLMYYLRKQKDKRQSKLSDDSEMRFLSDNEEMEYSDASVLDKILRK